MVLNRFPNHQLEIMINALLVALLYDLELGFHILVSLTNQITVVFFGQVCLVHLSYFFLVSYLLCGIIVYFPKAKFGYSISFKSKDSKPFNGTKHIISPKINIFGGWELNTSRFNGLTNILTQLVNLILGNLTRLKVRIIFFPQKNTIPIN